MLNKKTKNNNKPENQDTGDHFYYNDQSDVQEVFEGLRSPKKQYSSFDDYSEDNY